MRLAPRFKLPVWILVWVITRAVIVVQIGFWQPGGAEYEDVNTYAGWSDHIAGTHTMPPEDTWQYPPGAALLFLVPRLMPLDFKPSFVVLMLIIDLIGFWLMTVLARREGKDTGVWIWLLAMPLLFAMPILRFDIVPTVIGIAALVVLHRRPTWFGVLAGLGATIKVWPAFVLFGEWDRRRLLRSVIAAGVTVGAIFLVAWIAFGDQTGFLHHQKDRGLQLEAVATSPWEMRHVIDETPTPVVPRFGTNEVDLAAAGPIAKALEVAAVLVLLAAAWWWWRRDRAIRNGRDDLADEALARDFVFTIVLLFLVTSRVLSPQFMIWMVGLSGVVLTAGRTRLARPAWIVIAAVVLTAGLYQTSLNLVMRNTALLVAAIDACITLYLVLREPPTETDSATARAPGPLAVDSG
jgi:Glycosyltransferase family 87